MMRNTYLNFLHHISELSSVERQQQHGSAKSGRAEKLLIIERCRRFRRPATIILLWQLVFRIIYYWLRRLSHMRRFAIVHASSHYFSLA
jgi:hypothetical protein